MSYFFKEESISKGEACKLKEIPHLNSPSKISQLNFAHNDIRVIPPHIIAAANLQMIDLSHNKISKIQNILEVTSLKFINLSHNLIFQVPDKIVQLIELQNLDLGFNRIGIMNNIRVLKNLVQLRTFEHKGFIEVNLQGNQVLKKKGCRQIYKKWMNPNVQEYNKINKRSCYQNVIARTQRRMSKSLENQTRSKDNTLMETKKSLILPHHNVTVSSFNPCKESILNKNKQNMSTSQVQLQEHLKHSPNFTKFQQAKQSHQHHSLELIGLPAKSQMLKSDIMKDLIFIHQIKEVSITSEWFAACVTRLKELTNIFTLIISNDDIKVLEKEVKDKIVEQSLYAKEIVNTSLDTIELVLHEHFTNEDFTKYTDDIGMMFNKIKEIHKETIAVFNSKDYLPIKLYKPWVMYYRQLKHLVLSIPPKIRLYQTKCMRDRQIQDLISISPEKEELEQLPSQQAKSKGSGVKAKPNIDELLFSKQKQDFLLLSDCKRSNSQKKLWTKDEGECQNCLVMKWESTRSKEDLKEISEKIQEMEKQRTLHLDQLKTLQQVKRKYLNLISRQDLIIEELQTIKPSTYQNMLLEQAKAIEYMIGLQPLIFSSKELTNPKSSINRSVSIAPEKDKEILNTRLSSGKQKKESNRNSKKISEFTVEGPESGGSAVRGSSYFKNKNVITTINRTEDEYKTMINREDMITEPNNQGSETRQRGEIVVSQFNSEANSLEDQKKQKSYSKINIDKSLKRRSSSGKRSSQAMSKTIQKEKTQNDVILVSEQSVLKREAQHSSPIYSSKAKNHQNLMEQYIQSQSYQKLLEQKLQTDKSKRVVVKGESYNKFGGQISLQKDKHQKKKRNEYPEDQNKENKCPQRAKRNKTAQFLQHYHLNRYKEHTYIPMQSIEADNYKKYMQYHLRNNIIDILSKKSGHPCVIEKKYVNGTKSQKLIHKRSESELLKNSTERSQVRDINKTFR